MTDFKQRILASLQCYADGFLPVIKYYEEQGNHRMSYQLGIQMHEVQLCAKVVQDTPEQPLDLNNPAHADFLSSLGGFEGDE